MTTTTTETTPAEALSTDETTAVDTQDTLEETESAETQDDAASKGGNAEAAKYRKRLRDTEAERDQLAGALDALRRAEVARVAAVVLSQGSDLLDIGGHDIAELLTESGSVDAERVTELAKELQLARPGLSRHGIGNSHHNFGQVATGPATGRGGAGTTWAQALRGR